MLGCPSCHQRRALDTATFIRDEVCLPVPHRHWVFTIPRILRNVFRKEPEAVTNWMPTGPRYKRERARPDENDDRKNSGVGEIQPLEDGLLLEIEYPDP